MRLACSPPRVVSQRNRNHSDHPDHGFLCLLHDNSQGALMPTHGEGRACSVALGCHGSLCSTLRQLDAHLKHFRNVGEGRRISDSHRPKGYVLVGTIDGRRELPVSCHLLVILK